VIGQVEGESPGSDGASPYLHRRFPGSPRSKTIPQKRSEAIVAGERIVIVVADPSASLDEFGKAFARELIDRGKCMLELWGGNEQLEHGADD
jgi:hypothetical protein